MIKEQRRDKILAELRRKKIISLDELSTNLEVSRSTLHRDIEYLEEIGALNKIHGGITSTQNQASFEPPYVVRKDMYFDEKARIAEKAKELIKPRETVLLDTGSTVHQLAEHLDDATDLYIATNSLITAMVLSENQNITLLVLGGTLRTLHYSINGLFTDQMISQIHADKFFMGVDAIDFSIGFMNFSVEETQAKRLMIQASNETIVLCDHSKFEKIAFVNICPLRSVSTVITGVEADPKAISKLEETGITVIQV